MNTYMDDVCKLASFGELDDLNKARERGIDLDGKDDCGFTPLLWAARNGQDHVLNFLIENGSKLDAASFGGLSSLHHACNKNESGAIKILVKAKANVNALDENGDTPLVSTV